MTDTKRYTAEELQGLSNEELDVIVAMLKGAYIERNFGPTTDAFYLRIGAEPFLLMKMHPHGYSSPIEDHWHHVWVNCASGMSHPATDSKAALLLLDEMLPQDKKRICHLIMDSAWGEGVVDVGYFVPQCHTETGKRDTLADFAIEGKPSVALPRAITIAFIMYKQSNGKT